MPPYYNYLPSSSPLPFSSPLAPSSIPPPPTPSHCRVFRKMLYTDNSSVTRKHRRKPNYKPSDGYIEKYDFRGQPTVIVSDFEPEVFKLLIEYTHTGSVMLQARTLLGLMNAADHYGLEELKLACIRFMEHCITVDTVCSLLSSAEKYIQYKSTKILVQKMFEFVDQNADIILSLGAFSVLPQHVVRIVMGREELHATETTKFEAALRWSIRYTEDHPDLTLRQAFEPFVDVIDFFQIPAKHLMQNVKPADVVDDATILNALAYQADPRSVEHIKTRMRRTIASTSPKAFRHNSPTNFRRVQSSGQTRPPAQNGTEVLAVPSDPRLVRGGSVPPYESQQKSNSREKIHARGDIHPIRVHDIRDRSESRGSQFSSSPMSSPLSPASYHGSLSSFEEGGGDLVTRESCQPKKLTYNSLDTVVTLSSSKAVEV